MRGGRHHPWLLLSIASLMLATATAAEAQTWLSDRKRAEGSGIRLGDFELHPGLGAEFGYLSNVYNAEDGEELDSAAVRIAPHLYLSTLTEERAGENVTPGMLKLRGGISGTLQHYFADGAPAGPDVGADLSLQATIAPERPLSFTITEVFSRSFKPFSDPVTEPTATGEPTVSDDLIEDAPDVDYDRYNQTIGARLLGQTSGGLIQGGLGYRLQYMWFEDDQFEANDFLRHTADLSGAWQFLPKTALFYELSYSHQNYTNNDDSAGADAGLVDNDQVSARLGFNGAITSRISATLGAGYSAGFFGGNDFEGITLNAEGRWTPTVVSEWGLGFERSFASSFAGNFVLIHQIYARIRQFIGGAFVLQSKLSVEFLDFGPDPNQDNEERSDIRYSADLSGEYRFVDWLAVTGQLSAVYDDTDYVQRAEVELPDGEVVELADALEYKAFEAWIGLRAFY